MSDPVSGDWKPGDMAMLKINTRSGRWQRGVRIRPCEQYPYYVWQVDGGGLSEQAVDEARPLVVIDPEDREQAGALLAAYTATAQAPYRAEDEPDDWRTDRMQDALRSLIAPPKPPEPTGIGAVVEDSKGQRWVRGHASDIAPWVRVWTGGDRAPLWRYWTGIHAPRVLSKGVTT